MTAPLLLSRLPRIKVVTTDILTIEFGVIVHGCNAQGVMNSGLAKQVKEQYPEVFQKYKAQQPIFPNRARGTIPLGSISHVEVSEGKWIVNAITQFNYGYDGKRYVSYDAVDIAFRNVARMCFEIYQARGYMPSVHIPRIGAARGGGDLRSILELVLAAIPESVDIILHAPPFQGREENGGLG